MLDKSKTAKNMFFVNQDAGTFQKINKLHSEKPQ